MELLLAEGCEMHRVCVRVCAPVREGAPLFDASSWWVDGARSPSVLFALAALAGCPLSQTSGSDFCRSATTSRTDVVALQVRTCHLLLGLRSFHSPGPRLGAQGHKWGQLMGLFLTTSQTLKPLNAPERETHPQMRRRKHSRSPTPSLLYCYCYTPEHGLFYSRQHDL